ncbi:hypothetical protein GGS26DRAFT_589402 [Hypomontagnella submonticulosa]|nr:hypothetical protein GGS26DRAFT_589402 [Hypomontagnella submonticulosa]
MTNGDDESGNSSDDDDTSDSKSCSYLLQHGAQFHVIQKCAQNSCPELHRQLDNFDRTILRQRAQGNQEQPIHVRSKLEKSRRRYRFHARSAVSRQFRWLGHRFRRSGSSTISIKSEFPAPPDSKERRFLARDSAEIWSSSGDESPIFNTPESNIANAKHTHNSSHHLDPLAMASMMIATAELDRLSSRVNLERTSGTSGSSTGFSGSSPISLTPFHSGTTAPSNGASLSESNAIDTASTVPFNSPLSSGQQSGVASPASRPTHRRGQRRRAQRSRLSEVTTPDDIASPAESIEDLTEGMPSFSSSQVETLPECSTILNSVNEGSLYPKPLEIRRGGQDTPFRETGLPGGIGDGNTAPEPDPLDTLLSIPPEKYGGSPQTSHSLNLNAEDAISTPARISSFGKTPGHISDQQEAHGAARSDDIGHAISSPATAPDLETLPSLTGTRDDQGSNHAMSKIPAERIASSKSDHDSSLDSCHPNTWSETQGEPGDSDPFCPHDCLETRHSGQEDYTELSRLVRQDSDATIHTVIVGQRTKSSPGKVVESMHKRKDTNSEPARL